MVGIRIPTIGGTGTKLYCLVTEAHVCEQLAHRLNNLIKYEHSHTIPSICGSKVSWNRVILPSLVFRQQPWASCSHTCASVTKQYNLVPVPVKGSLCPAAGKVTVALAVRHRLQWFVHLLAQGLRKGDEDPTYTPHGLWHTLPWQVCLQPPTSVTPTGSGSTGATLP